MIRALYTAATGMRGQDLKINTIANNISNVNTTGFKRSRVEFQDLLYHTVKSPGQPTSDFSENPTGIQVGHGTQPVAILKVFTEGNLRQTDRELDVAIEGDGFFQIRKNNETYYTRNGSFKLNSEGVLVNSQGYPLEPEITIPEKGANLMIGADGTVQMMNPDSTELIDLGSIELAKFVNPAGLEAVGKNLYRATEASGEALLGKPGIEGYGAIAQGFLENSNVDVAQELIEMILTQRAYEVSSRVIRTADQMLQYSNNIR